MDEKPRSITNILIGGGVALISIIIVVGSFALALLEGGVRVAPPASQMVMLPTLTNTVIFVSTPTLQPTMTSTLQEETTPNPTASPIQPTAVLPTYTPTPTLSKTPTSEASATIPSTQIALCGPPPGWVIYTVQPGDTLYRLSRSVGVSIAEIQWANCLGNSTTIRNGQQLFLPRIPPPPVLPTTPPPPVFIPTVTPLPTESPTATAPPATPVPTETLTMEPTLPPTDTPIPLPTDTPEPTTLPLLTATLPATYSP
jgi:LysM repeat protein